MAILTRKNLSVLLYELIIDDNDFARVIVVREDVLELSKTVITTVINKVIATKDGCS
jgi:hypothetical protein